MGVVQPEAAQGGSVELQQPVDGAAGGPDPAQIAAAEAHPRVFASLRSITPDRWQLRRWSLVSTVASDRSRSPVTRAPASRSPGVAPGSVSRAPSSSAVRTSARIVRSGPQAAPPAGSSAAGSPLRRSTQAPVG
nr:hypothetical protein GCM10020093_034950 [Planobispora longispora]